MLHVYSMDDGVDELCKQKNKGLSMTRCTEVNTYKVRSAGLTSKIGTIRTTSNDMVSKALEAKGKFPRCRFNEEVAMFGTWAACPFGWRSRVQDCDARRHLLVALSTVLTDRSRGA